MSTHSLTHGNTHTQGDSKSELCSSLKNLEVEKVNAEKIKVQKVFKISCPKFMPENGQLNALLNDYRKSKGKMKFWNYKIISS